MSEYSVYIKDERSLKVEFSLTRLKKITDTSRRESLRMIGVINKDIIKRNISELPRFGNVDYYKGKRRNASRPAESFANRSKDAMKTLGWDVRGCEYLESGFKLNEDTWYVKYLEEQLNRPTLEIASHETVGIGQNIMLGGILKAHEDAVK